MMDVTSSEQFQQFVRSHDKLLVYFWAHWSEPCQALDAVVTELLGSYPALACAKVEAESVTDVSSHLQVAAVPTFVLLQQGDVVDRLEGYDPSSLAIKVEALMGPMRDVSPVPASKTEPPSLEKRLRALVGQKPVMLFMKGSPDAPRCGFSGRVVQALRQSGISFGHFDILQDNEVREGLKSFSNWPTYPQVYAGGELLGGCDIILEMTASGELKEAVVEALLPKQSPQQADIKGDEDNVEQRIKDLLASAPVWLFMKGSPEAPRCKFSRSVVEKLQAAGVEFRHYDILEDPELRAGLKEFSSWPTYPQLYVNAELVGGCDIIEELERTGELLSTIQDAMHQPVNADRSCGEPFSIGHSLHHEHMLVTMMHPIPCHQVRECT